MTALAVVIAAAIQLCTPQRAAAYRTFADDPAVNDAASFHGDALSFELSTAGASADDLASFEAAVTLAIATWRSVDCSSANLQYAGRTDASGGAGDGRNTITLVYHDWTARGLPSGRGASTDVQLRQSGPNVEIAEADIYLNLSDFEFGVGQAPLLDPQTVLIHEVGHALGLLHPCEFGAAGIPDCSTDALARDSALYPIYDEVRPRPLSEDDIDGVCALYPLTGCPLSCGVGQRCTADACMPCAHLDCSPACPGPQCVDTACGPNATCAEGQCAAYGAASGHCVNPAASGALCSSGMECASGLCLVQANSGFCTEGCVRDDDCPANEWCATVSGRSVCEPRRSSSCAVTLAARARPSCFLLLILIASVRSWRRNRSV